MNIYTTDRPEKFKTWLEFWNFAKNSVTYSPDKPEIIYFDMGAPKGFLDNVVNTQVFYTDFVKARVYDELGGVDRFKKPTDDQLVKFAILYNDGIMDIKKLTDMTAMCTMIIDRLYENGDCLIPSVQEIEDSNDHP